MKILVVGAGPAGLSAALNATKEGHEVQVFEKDNCLGGKVCGEALGREALDFVGLEPSERFVKNYAKGFSISFKGEFIREAEFKEHSYAPGYVVDKKALLEAMLEKALNFGAKVSFGERAQKVGVDGRITLENGEVKEGDLVVCADGAATLARNHLDYASHRFVTCLQYRCTLPASIKPDYLYLDIIGEGYAWAFPKDNHANVGIGSMKGSQTTTLRSYLEEYIRRLGCTPIGKIMTAPVCIGGPLKRFRVGRLVVAGESAGCVMPLSGEGTRFAIYGGSIAWHPNYHKQFMQKYGDNMERSLRMLSLVNRLSDKGRIMLLKSLEDPIDTLEGKKLVVSRVFFKPGLLKELLT